MGGLGATILSQPPRRRGHHRRHMQKSRRRRQAAVRVALRLPVRRPETHHRQRKPNRQLDHQRDAGIRDPRRHEVPAAQELLPEVVLGELVDRKVVQGGELQGAGGLHREHCEEHDYLRCSDTDPQNRHHREEHESDHRRREEGPEHGNDNIHDGTQHPQIRAAHHTQHLLGNDQGQPRLSQTEGDDVAARNQHEDVPGQISQIPLVEEPRAEAHRHEHQRNNGRRPDVHLQQRRKGNQHQENNAEQQEQPVGWRQGDHLLLRDAGALLAGVYRALEGRPATDQSAGYGGSSPGDHRLPSSARLVLLLVQFKWIAWLHRVDDAQ
mmetsp:Transcript_51291/g.135068  ORF Transcript_51291/g.135068 Transcript_51291/m.135068 type:complete len:324 (-) Transcript_51291:131-1102(-)